MTLLRRFLQGAAFVTPVSRKPVHVGAIFKKRPANVNMSLPGSDRQRCPTLVTPVVSVSPMAQKRIANSGVPFARNDEKRRGAVLAESIDICLHLEHVVADVSMSDITCLMKRSVAVRPFGVQCAAALDQQFQNPKLTAVRRFLQKSRALGLAL